MSATVHIGSSGQWRQVLSSSSVVIADFYADWCGPCKMIAPTFEALSKKHSKARKVTFCKVNVDNQPDVAQQHGVRAMPTFLVLHNGSVVDTIQGANPPALTAAVEKAVRLAGAGGAGGSSTGPGAPFGTPGRTLGGDGVAAAGPRGGAGSNAARRAGAMVRSLRWDLKRLIDIVVGFFGLYFVSLFALDPYKAAEFSQYNRISPPESVKKTTTAPGQKPGAPRPAFRTMADL